MIASALEFSGLGAGLFAFMIKFVSDACVLRLIASPPVVAS